MLTRTIAVIHADPEMQRLIRARRSDVGGKYMTEARDNSFMATVGTKE